MKTCIILLLSPLFAGETFVFLEIGRDERRFLRPFSLPCQRFVERLPHVTLGRLHQTLFLMLRNDGAKFMSFGDIAAEDFSLRDAEGQEISIYLRTSPQDVKGIQYGETTV